MVEIPSVRQDFAIPILDISAETYRQVVVAYGTERVYQGQVNTVLMGDGKTLYAVWSIPHGGWCGPMKKSVDGGLTWSRLLPTPEDWRKVRSCPCIFRLTDGDGVERLLVFAGKGELCQAVSEDGGLSWTGLRPNGLPSMAQTSRFYRLTTGGGICCSRSEIRGPCPRPMKWV